MNTPTFFITSILESSQGNLKELRKKLFEKGVLTKDYIEDGLMLLYHKYDSPVTNELERECRSLVVDCSTLKIKSYSCETPRVNKEGMNYITMHSDEPQIIKQCYEGTYLSVFFHNEKWYVSTRRCLNSHDSAFTHENRPIPNITHYDMFNDIIIKAGYNGFHDFSQKLDTSYSYYFVLIHNQNKHIIDYTSQFGSDYGRICLTSIRDSEMRELDIYENKVSFASYDNTGFIFVPERLESLENFNISSKIIKYNEEPSNEGVVVKVWNSSMNKYHLIKLQTMDYQFAQVLGTSKNIFKGFIYLYQNGRLFEYFQQKDNAQSIRKIVNPLNTSESYDTTGVIDAVFKVCTSELFELFKNLYSLKTGQQQNKKLYELLPSVYREMIYSIRGIYYKKKASLMNKENVPPVDIKNTHLKISDIYNYLKTVPTESIVSLLHMRKLMFNWVNINTNNNSINEFGTISNFCDRIHIKLCAIFTNKLFPNIIPTDIPNQVQANNNSVELN
jgi:hypothetical protein